MATRQADVGLDPVASVVAACHEPFHEAWSSLQEQLATRLIEAVRRSAARHREVVASVGLDGSPPEGHGTRAERLLDYRRAVDSELLDPLMKSLRHGGPAASIEHTLGTALETCVSRCEALPAEVAATWSEGALAARPSDNMRRRLGKLLARGFSAARSSGGERSIPLRSFALHHLARIVPEQDEIGVQAMLAWAAWGQRLELAWTEWGDTALPALVRAELLEDEEEVADDEEAESRSSDLPDPWTRVREAGEVLQTRLEALGADEPLVVAAADARARLDDARDVLEADTAVLGSFLLRPSKAVPPPELSRLSRSGPELREWDDGVAARMHAYAALLAILSGATAVQARLVARVRKRCLGRLGNLSDTASSLDEIREEVGRPDEARAKKRLGRLDGPVNEALEPALEAIPTQAFVDTTVQEVSDSSVEALTAMIRQAPSELRIHALDASPPSKGRRPETRTLELEGLARQSFDALRMERIRASTASLRLTIEEIRSEVSGLPEVFSFAHDEAMRELEGDGEEAAERAVALVTGALSSMSESLRAQTKAIDAALVEAHRRLSRELCDGSAALLDRVAAGRVQAQLLAARSWAVDLVAWLRERVAPWTQWATRYVVRHVRRARGLLARALRRGTTYLGGASAEEGASARAVRTLADARAILADLPLVYQRLFTLEPLSDATLLAGRSSQLGDAMIRWKRWHAGEGVPLLVRGRHGSGITSFINVVGAQIEEDGGTVERIALDTRVSDEADLAGRIATTLGLPESGSLDELAKEIFDAEERALPAVMSIDNLEHVYLRVPGGTDLIERLLTLMAETEPRVFWIGGITTSAWQLVTTTEHTAASQVDVFDLPPLDADSLREAVLARHRRSGLSVRYEEPTTGRHLLKRRLRRMRDPHTHQATLEEDFFDQLYRISGGYLALALFQWLLSADFASGDGVVQHQPERPDFSMLDALDLTQNFTLKAFLEHRTLTLAEHDLIFRLPRHESYQIFESLRNRHLIEPANSSGDTARRRSEMQQDLRYRVRSLLTGAVISHLQGRNIVH